MALFTLLSRFWKFIVAVAILKWMSFHVWVLNIWYGQSLEVSLWDSVISNILLVSLALGVINIIVRYIPGKGKFWFTLGMSFAMAWVWQWLVWNALTQLFSEMDSYILFLQESLPVRWTIGFLILAGTSISSVFYSMYAERLIDSKLETESLSRLRDAELQKLQLQLQPHFLFNSLNSINAMILSNPDKAREMVEQLSDFLRITTKRADQHWVNFSEEWSYVQLYLAIERVRFGHRLEIKHQVDDQAMNFTIPSLVLQPLIENAIKFGLYGTTDKVTINVLVSFQNEILSIKIDNPYDAESQPTRGSGFGLSGLKRRLYLLFARNDLLETESSSNKFTITLKLPKHHA